MSREGESGSLLSTVWVEVAVHQIGDVRVPVGSPVLELEILSHALGEVLFYFVEPPFLYGRSTQFTLAVANAIIRDEVLAWKAAIRQAQGTIKPS
jgi:hypothetical protein